MRGGLTSRAILASAVLAVLIGSAFGVLVGAIDEQRDSAAAATRSQEVLAAANRLERLVLDLETGQRGFVIAGEERFLQPWSVARQTAPEAAETLIRVSGVNGQGDRARRIAASIDAYLHDYSVPLVEAARRGDPSARRPAALAEGKRRVDALREEFDAFVDAERRLFATREARADDDARRAVLAAAIGLVGSVLLILMFGGYLIRAVTLPIRRAAAMAGRIAGGDLRARMPETGVGEVGTLERAFNTMAGSLEQSQDELRALADEQASLRRVATLVARAVPPEDIFDAATAEVRDLLGADVTALLRVEPDGTVTRVAEQAVPGHGLPEPAPLELRGETLTATVLRAGGPVLIDGGDTPEGSLAADLHRRGIRAAVAAPIAVEGRLWGAIVAAWASAGAPSPDSQARLSQFTELVATAIANAHSRAELAASRARVVATADETRRRIERDLHDGAQQSLVHALITLKLARRCLGDSDGPEREFLDQALDHAERANTELRDLAHGILPATLSRGLEAALETLVARLHLPVSLDVTPERLPPDVEATAYFIVAEALTNTIKHAGASKARVRAQVEDGTLRIEVQDDGVGGASLDAGTGLLGLYDRAAALNGELRVDSPPGGGTTIAVTLPLPES